MGKKYTYSETFYEAGKNNNVNSIYLTSRALQEGINVTFSKQIAGGFKIGPKNGGYLISFSDNDFERLIAEYLRPATKKLLFG